MTAHANSTAGPAPRPCNSCPYRVDVPSGIWHPEEYVRLTAYDAPTGEQPAAVFLCHQTNAGDPSARVCAGWAGCHGSELLALRLAASSGAMDAAEVAAAMDYTSPVELWPTGADAAAHGLRDITDPGPAAQALIEKIRTRRNLA